MPAERESQSAMNCGDYDSPGRPWDYALLAAAAAASVPFIAANAVIVLHRNRKFFRAQGGACLILTSSIAGLVWIVATFIINFHFPRDHQFLLSCPLWSFWLQLTFGFWFWLACQIVRLLHLYRLCENLTSPPTRNPSKWRTLVYGVVMWFFGLAFAIIATASDAMLRRKLLKVTAAQNSDYLKMSKFMECLHEDVRDKVEVDGPTTYADAVAYARGRTKKLLKKRQASQGLLCAVGSKSIEAVAVKTQPMLESLPVVQEGALVAKRWSYFYAKDANQGGANCKRAIQINGRDKAEEIPDLETDEEMEADSSGSMDTDTSWETESSYSRHADKSGIVKMAVESAIVVQLVQSLSRKDEVVLVVEEEQVCFMAHEEDSQIVASSKPSKEVCASWLKVMLVSAVVQWVIRHVRGSLEEISTSHGWVRGSDVFVDHVGVYSGKGQEMFEEVPRKGTVCANCQLQNAWKYCTYIILPLIYFAILVVFLYRARNTKDYMMAIEYSHTCEYSFTVTVVIYLLFGVTVYTESQIKVPGRCFLTFCICFLVFVNFWVRLGWPVYLCLLNKESEMDKFEEELRSYGAECLDNFSSAVHTFETRGRTSSSLQYNDWILRAVAAAKTEALECKERINQLQQRKLVLSTKIKQLESAAPQSMSSPASARRTL
ncbi:hypothetical protein L7F22_014943 [Adiantum nelumboides]|nr:hypothetical protein [Adiantum nelumboides]